MSPFMAIHYLPKYEMKYKMEKLQYLNRRLRRRRYNVLQHYEADLQSCKELELKLASLGLLFVRTLLEGEGDGERHPACCQHHSEWPT